MRTARALQRTRHDQGLPAPPVSYEPYLQPEPFNTPYGLRMIDDCGACATTQEEWFCHFTTPALQWFARLGQPSIFPRGAALFMQGQEPRGVFVLCSGRVRMSMLSMDGKMLVLKIAEAGEVLGLSAVVAGSACELTAETATPCQVRFIEREAILKLIREHAEAGLNCAQALSRDFQAAYAEIRGLVMARSSAGKLARLLLSWSPPPGREDGETRIESRLTHEEIGQMIGSSRETVTRVLSQLKKRQCIRLDGTTLVICDRRALEVLAA
jgi:CRP/FNR family cyclic AMP-dependent transcriptional regulator